MFDAVKAQRAVDFFSHLKHTKGKWHGHPFELLDWQDEIIRDVFGTVKDDGCRQYSSAYIEVPKKNGKSEIGAGIALQGLCADDEWQAEVYGCAADRAQASIVFDVAVDMIDQWPVLKAKCKLVASQKRIIYLPTKSFYQVLSAEAFSKHGLNVHRVVFDELHAQPNRNMYDVMTKGSGDARAQPLFFVISTAGDDPDRTSIGWEVHKKAVDVLTGNKIDPTFYARIWGIEPEEKRVWSGRSHVYLEDIDQKYADLKNCDGAWKDQRVWNLTNPSLDITVPVSKVIEAVQSADGNPAEERLVRWLRFNEWIKYRLTKWIGQEIWDATSNGMIIPENLRGQECYGGLDLSSKTDITAFILLFPPTESRLKWHVLPTFWIPEMSLKERVLKDKVPYDKWLANGFLKTTPGNVIDYNFIEAEIIKMRDMYDIQEIGFDPWNAQQTATNLDDKGVTMVEVRQGFKSMSPAMKELEKLLIGKELEHGGDPVLRWMFGNLEVKQDENENVRPVKSRATERIDGIVSLINAIARAMLTVDDTSVYEERGIRTL